MVIEIIYDRYMMNKEIGYNPYDRTSFPYQHDDPPFSQQSLKLSLRTQFKMAEGIGIVDQLEEMKVACQANPNSGYRMLDMALRLFTKLEAESHEGKTTIDLFVSAIEQAFEWELG
jgi:hypothetical protein